jgi:hypothetical protein
LSPSLGMGTIVAIGRGTPGAVLPNTHHYDIGVDRLLHPHIPTAGKAEAPRVRKMQNDRPAVSPGHQTRSGLPLWGFGPINPGFFMGPTPHDDSEGIKACRAAFAQFLWVLTRSQCTTRVFFQRPI